MQNFIKLALVVSEKNGYNGHTDLWIYDYMHIVPYVGIAVILVEITKMGLRGSQIL